MSLREELLRTHLRLFLSVDVQNSTAFKQSKESAHSSSWREYFVAFFRDFPAEFERQVGSKCTPARVWKLLGDEIVFTRDVTNLEEVPVLLGAFRDAVASYEGHPPKPRELRLKGTAWTAGFPVGNAVVPGRNGSSIGGDSSRQGFDYIGPSMDTGFRLSRLASHRKFGVSVELAWLILQLPKFARKGVGLRYDGRCQLKGVMERDGYPFIWIDVFQNNRGPLLEAEDRLLKHEIVADSRSLRRFCEHYIREHGEPSWTPFVPGVFDKRSAKEKIRFAQELKDVRSVVRRLWPEEDFAREDSLRGTRKIGAESVLRKIMHENLVRILGVSDASAPLKRPGK